MFSFVEPQLAEFLVSALRDVAADAIPRAFAAAAALAITTLAAVRLRRSFRRGQRPRRPLPAPA
jgi:hypothetical protein